MCLLDAQKEVVYGQLALAEGAPSPYWMGDYFDLVDLSIDRLTEAVAQVVARTPAIRTRFFYRDGEVRQHFPLDARPEIHVRDLSAEADPWATCSRYMADALSEPCDLLHAPLMDFTVYKLDASRSILFERGHHAIVDAYGGGLYIAAIAAAYTYGALPEFELKGPADLVADAPDANGEELEPDWPAMTSVHILPWFRGSDFPAATAMPARATRKISRSTVDRMKELAAEWSVRLESVYVAAVAQSLSDQFPEMTEFAVLIPTHGRSKETRAAIGMAANMVPVTLPRRPADSELSQFVQECDRRLRASLVGRRFRIEQYRKSLDKHVGERMYTVPIINIISYYQELTFGNCSAPPISMSTGAAHGIEITVLDSSAAAGVDLHIDCNADALEPSDAASFSATLSGVLADFTATATGPAESAADGVSAPCARRTTAVPAQVALVGNGRTHTYGQLCSAAAELARRLADSGIGAGDRVLVAAPHSTTFPIAALAVAQLGAVYVPVALPMADQRLSSILESAHPAAMVVEGSVEALVARHLPPGVVTVLHDQDSPDSTASEAQVPAMLERIRDLHYMIFTSGSTGAPKGVLVGGGSTRALIEPTLRTIDARPGMVWLAQHTFGFDFSVWEMLGALLSAGSLVVPDDAARRSLDTLADTVETHGVDVLNITPDAFNALEVADIERIARVSGCIVFGGARLTLRSDVAEILVRRTAAFNMYGITEGTVHSTAYPIGLGDIRNGSHGARSVSIGRPLPEVTGFVLGDDLVPVGAGGVGELYLAGAQLAVGYFGQVGLTAERFVPCPFGSGEVMFRTGDLVRVGLDGGFSYVGRSDFQLNVRGHRVEPGEIEFVAVGLPGVERCVVVERGVGSVSLMVAFVTVDAGVEVCPDRVRAEIGARLPDYMVPNRVVVVDAIPLTTSGKVDRRALGEVPLDGDRAAGAGVAGAGVAGAGSDVERVVCEVFGEVLQCGEVGPSDDFFELGGHSLAALRVSRLLDERRGWRMPPAAVLKNPTPSALAALVVDVPDEAGTPTSSTARGDVAGGSALNGYNSTLAVMLGTPSGRLRYQIPLVVHWSDPAARERALERVSALARADGRSILRDVFVLGAAGSASRQLPDVRVTPWPHPALDVDQTIREVCAAAAARPEIPALEVYTFDGAGGDHIAVFLFSHLHFDDVSVRWVFEHAIASGEHPAPNHKRSYVDFVQPPGAAKLIASDYADRIRKTLAQTDVLFGVTAHAGSAAQSGRTVVVPIPVAMSEKIGQPVHLRNTTLFVLLNVAIRAALAAAQQGTTFTIGTAVSLRESQVVVPETRNNLGYALNTVLVPQSLDESRPVSDAVAETRTAVADAIEFAAVPYAAVVSELYRSGAAAGAPAIGVWAQLTDAWQYDTGTQITHAGLADNGITKFPLTYFLETSSGLPTRLLLQYDSAETDEDSIRRLGESTVQVLCALSDCTPSTQVSRLVGEKQE
ncbi:amino acid adenylation domain-containing protein [Rhodococcus pyridinivorans]|uniref:amino acid adenylation domain-containing protein n=1 Tax=Rhodococcus pyridinivorans TaxID=103816 RepID=UPI002494EB75|nr:amino acid adenylation domain-containing protein [Rhodococcus pyridinivorans]